MKKSLLVCGMMATLGSAYADLTVTTGTPVAGTPYNLNDITYTGTAGLATGYVVDLHAVPYGLSDTTPYAYAGVGIYPSTANPGKATIALGQTKALSLLWGSVDLGNTLAFYEGSTLVGTVTGATFDPTADGLRGPGGTFIVSITSTLNFDKVVATSDINSFEFAEVDTVAAPEPAFAGAMVGAGVLAFSLRRHFRRSVV